VAPAIAHRSRQIASRRPASSLITSLACRSRCRATSTRPTGNGSIPAISGSVQVSTVAPVPASPSSSLPTPTANRPGSNSGSRISFIPTVTLTRSGRQASTAAAGSSEGNCHVSTASTPTPSLARLASVHGTPVRSPSIPASRLAHPIRTPPGPRSSRPAVRLSPSATYRGQLPAPSPQPKPPLPQ